MRWARLVVAVGVAVGVTAAVLLSAPARALPPCNVHQEAFAYSPTRLLVDGVEWQPIGSGAFQSDAGVVLQVGGAIAVQVTDDPLSLTFAPPECSATARTLTAQGLTDPLTGASGSMGFAVQP